MWEVRQEISYGKEWLPDPSVQDIGSTGELAQGFETGCKDNGGGGLVIKVHNSGCGPPDGSSRDFHNWMERTIGDTGVHLDCIR